MVKNLFDCPDCGAPLHYDYEEYYRCKKCGVTFSLTGLYNRRKALEDAIRQSSPECGDSEAPD